MQSAVVLGAGLAGLTAAIDLIDAGWQVTLVERRPFPGGRTFSYEGQDGEVLDNGQHVFLGCCMAYLALLDKLGQREKAFLQPRLDVRVIDDQLGPAILEAAPLPAPLHLLPSFLRLPYLSLPEKLAALRALVIIRVRELPEDETFMAWLARHGQSRNAIERLWNLLIVPTCNATADRVSARMGGFIFREGLLRTSWGGRIGYARVGLSEIVPDAAVAYLRERGAQLRFNTGVREVCTTQAGVTSLLTSQGDKLEASVFVLGVTPDELARLLPTAWTERAARLPYAPIIGVNLWYDSPVFEGDVLATIVNGQGYWLFDRTRILGLAGPDHHIAVSISAADSHLDTSKDELAQEVAALLSRVLPGARQAKLQRSSVNKVPRATFVPGPGIQRDRLGETTPLANLFLAGAWTDTGWPDTMESAVRSGHKAAIVALRSAAAHDIQESSH